MLEWPALSPDLNPIEELWWEFKKQVLKQYPHLGEQGNNDETRQNLIDACQKVWQSIRRSLLRKLIQSMPRRIEAVIKARGWQTKY